MPFVQTLTRNTSQLTGFFESTIKGGIENSENYRGKIRVFRSENDLNITDSIIKSIFESDYLIADLSGEYGNPNVMYELGVRLAGTDKPVILIRESNERNKDIFDIRNLHTFHYDPMNPADVQRYIIDKLNKFETGAERYVSPVLDVANRDRTIVFYKSKRRFEFLIRSALRSCYAQRMNLLQKIELLLKSTPDVASYEIEKMFPKRGNTDKIAESVYNYFTEESKRKIFEGIKINLSINDNKAIDSLLDDVDIFDSFNSDLYEPFTGVLDYYNFRHLSGGGLIGEIPIFKVLDFMADTNLIINFLETLNVESVFKYQLEEEAKAFSKHCSSLIEHMRGGSGGAQEQGSQITPE